MLEKIREWDVELFVYLNNLGIEEYDSFWIFVTSLIHWIPLYIGLFVFYFVVFPKKKALFSSLFLLASFIATFTFTNFVKNMSVRLRPNNNPDLLELIRILQTPSNYSFFSGHASASFVVTTFFVLSLRKKYKWVYLLYIWPILFVISRVYVGVHYPSDLIVGAFVGSMIGIIFYIIYKRAIQRI